MVAVDLDDTLLHSDLTISARAKAAVARMVAQGIKVVVTTGRMYVAALPFWRQLGLSDPVIAYQGASVMDPVTGKSLFSTTVPLPLARDVVAFARQHKVHVQLYSGDTYYYPEWNRFSEFYQKTSSITGQHGDLDALLANGEEPVKLIYIDDPDAILALDPLAQAALGDKLAISISKPEYLEFTNKSADKGKAVRFLAEMWGFDPSEVATFGDGANDVPMFEYAGLGVAMANARPEVQQAADVVTLSNDEDGAAIAFERYILGDDI